MLAKVAGMGVTHFAMEASSHGIDQRRLDGVTLKDNPGPKFQTGEHGGEQPPIATVTRIRTISSSV